MDGGGGVPPLRSRMEGALWGIFIADALAMPRALAADFGRITGYVAAPSRHATNTIMASHWAHDKHG
eukprot:gene54543-39326_t